MTTQAMDNNLADFDRLYVTEYLSKGQNAVTIYLSNMEETEENGY